MTSLKNRLTHWQSTLPGVAILILLGFFAWLKPELLDNTTALLGLAAGLFGLLKGGQSSDGDGAK